MATLEATSGPLVVSELNMLNNGFHPICISPPVEHFGVWDHGWPKGGLKCRHAHPHLLDTNNKRIRANQNVGTTVSLKLGYLWYENRNRTSVP